MLACKQQTEGLKGGFKEWVGGWVEEWVIKPKITVLG
jgi:hypothetical protein